MPRAKKGPSRSLSFSLSLPFYYKGNFLHCKDIVIYYNVYSFGCYTGFLDSVDVNTVILTNRLKGYIGDAFARARAGKSLTLALV